VVAKASAVGVISAHRRLLGCQHVFERPVGLTVTEEIGDQLAQHLARLAPGAIGMFGGLDALAQSTRDNRGNQAGFGRKLAVERARADVGLGGDAGEPDHEAVSGEH
jgi:hypothetical protein